MIIKIFEPNGGKMNYDIKKKKKNYIIISGDKSRNSSWNEK